jgi:NAD(P)-dependent dehydrogenase (short-subunit alcohol dehydrogenase family)
MTDADGPVTVVETAVARYGRLDPAFNNVGGVVAPGRPADIDAAGWMAELELNLTSVFYCLRAQIPALLGAGRGRAGQQRFDRSGGATLPVDGGATAG